jgi:hypothetical protein
MWSGGRVLVGLGRRQAAVSTTDALAILAGVADPAARCRVMTDVALGLADQADPVFGSIIDQAALIAATDPHLEAPILAEVASRLAARDPARATTLSERALSRVTLTLNLRDWLDTYSGVARQLMVAGDDDRAVAIVRHALKSALDVRGQGWVSRSYVALLGWLAREDLDRARAHVSSLSGTEQAIARGELIEAAAETDLAAATRLFDEFDLDYPPVDAAGESRDRDVTSAGASALAAVLMAAAQQGSDDTVQWGERLWHYEHEASLLDLKCAALANAIGAVAATDLAAAEYLLNRVLPKLYGDPVEVGRALAAVVRADAQVGEHLAVRAVSAYLGRLSGERDQDICTACAELADVAPVLALELSDRGRGVSRNLADFPGYRSKVISRVAAAVSGSDRARADDLIDQAITDANQADSEWLKQTP